MSRSAVLAAAGIGLRTAHLASLATAQAAQTPAWVEIHCETFLCDGGPRLAMLDEVAARYPVSCHGVGLSLGAADGLDKAHLARLKRLIDRVNPVLVSEHLAWSVEGGAYLNDLLPLPTTEANLAAVCRNVSQAQETLGRKVLIENPSTYMRFAGAIMAETEFLSRLVDRTGCGLLLDVNNVFVSAANNRFDAKAYLDEVPAAAVCEIHLAGHTETGAGHSRLLVDTHNTRIAPAVWSLYAGTIARLGPRPTLIEWDADLPDLATLLNEAATAQAILDDGAPAKCHVA